MQVSISRIHFPVTTLGPGRRVGLWFQGCSIRCPGCISVDTWDAGRNIVDAADVVDRLRELSGSCDGLTVSGGEPFDQPDALAEILHGWRRHSATPTLVFTGREMQDVAGWFDVHPNLVDAVMTGPFRSDLPQTAALRGSDNQTLHVLTERGSAFRAYDRAAGVGDRRLDVMFDDVGDAWIAGIPARGDLSKLRRLLAREGHSASTSASIRETVR
jgi:anaerobic ribonucleoside-triphosphate reductase activating protein